MSLFPAVVDGQGKGGEHKRNHADNKVRLSQGRDRKDKDKSSSPSHSPQLAVFWSHRKHEHALFGGTHRLPKSMNTVSLWWHVLGIHLHCKNQTQASGFQQSIILRKTLTPLSTWVLPPSLGIPSTQGPRPRPKPCFFSSP